LSNCVPFLTFIYADFAVMVPVKYREYFVVRWLCTFDLPFQLSAFLSLIISYCYRVMCM